MALTLSFISFFFPLPLCEDIGGAKRSRWTKDNIHVWLQHHEWISPAGTCGTEMKRVLNCALYPPKWKVNGNTNANNWARADKSVCACAPPAFPHYQYPCASPCFTTNKWLLRVCFHRVFGKASTCRLMWLALTTKDELHLSIKWRPAVWKLITFLNQKCAEKTKGGLISQNTLCSSV